MAGIDDDDDIVLMDVVYNPVKYDPNAYKVSLYGSPVVLNPRLEREYPEWID